MVSTTTKPNNIIEKTTLAEQRVVFHNITWQNYQQILAALGQSRSSRLIYDQGTLEITMPLEEHESATRLIELFIRILVEESGLRIKTMGSTTLNRDDLQRSAEPDNCYYIQNQPQVVGKKVNLNEDPPPDLIVEVDITHTDINKLQFYASMGVPEFWRYNGETLQIYQLQNHQYVETEKSPTFSIITKPKLYQFLQDCQIDEVQAEKSFRAWVQQEIQN
jgi:Uma2 family endonuclease